MESRGYVCAGGLEALPTINRQQEAEERWAARCRALEEEVAITRREHTAAEQARREAAEARERQARELAALREEVGLLQQAQAAQAAQAQQHDKEKEVSKRRRRCWLGFLA